MNWGQGRTHPSSLRPVGLPTPRRPAEKALVPRLPLPSFPAAYGGTREETGWLARRRLKSFQIGKPAAAGPGRGRAFPGCLRRESPGRQQAARRNAAGASAPRGAGGGPARARPAARSLRGLSKTLGADPGEDAPPCPRAAPPPSPANAPPWRASEGDVGRNSTTSVSVSLYFIPLHFIFFSNT